MLATKQLINRYSERLTVHIMEGDVDSRNRTRQNAAALEILAPIQLLPQGARLPRIATDQELTDVLEGALHGELATGYTGLAPAMNPLIRLDLDDELIATPHPGWVYLDIGDLHGFPP
jgi:hypothetical protein